MLCLSVVQRISRLEEIGYNCSVVTQVENKKFEVFVQSSEIAFIDGICELELEQKNKCVCTITCTVVLYKCTSFHCRH